MTPSVAIPDRNTWRRRQATRRPSPRTLHNPKLPPPALPERTVTVVRGAVTVSLTTLLALVLPDPEQLSVYDGAPASVGVTISLPLVACVPLQEPLAVQEVAFVEDHVSVALCPSVIEVGLIERLTV